jgi:hypothetical protein
MDVRAILFLASPVSSSSQQLQAQEGKEYVTHIPLASKLWPSSSASRRLIIIGSQKRRPPERPGCSFPPVLAHPLATFFFLLENDGTWSPPSSLSLSTSSSRKTDYETDGVAAFNLLFLFLLKVSFFFFQLGYIKRGESTLLA